MHFQVSKYMTMKVSWIMVSLLRTLDENPSAQFVTDLEMVWLVPERSQIKGSS